jgi:hypothetical protein
MTLGAPWRQIARWPNSGQAERVIEIEPDPTVCAELARRFDLEGLHGLRARLTVRPWLDGLEITGLVRATASRICGVSLEPYEESLRESVEVRILPPGSPNLPDEDPAEVVVDLEAEDPPEAGEAEGADIAAIVAEAIALGLQPFARKPGAEFETPEQDPVASPFAVLGVLSRQDPPTT